MACGGRLLVIPPAGLELVGVGHLLQWILHPPGRYPLVQLPHRAEKSLFHRVRRYVHHMVYVDRLAGDGRPTGPRAGPEQVHIEHDLDLVRDLGPAGLHVADLPPHQVDAEGGFLPALPVVLGLWAT